MILVMNIKTFNAMEIIIGDILPVKVRSYNLSHPDGSSIETKGFSNVRDNQGNVVNGAPIVPQTHLGKNHHDGYS